MIDNYLEHLPDPLVTTGDLDGGQPQRADPQRGSPTSERNGKVEKLPFNRALGTQDKIPGAPTPSIGKELRIARNAAAETKLGAAAAGVKAERQVGKRGAAGNEADWFGGRVVGDGLAAAVFMADGRIGIDKLFGDPDEEEEDDILK